MDLVCLYTNHWFLSFVIILIILSKLGIELSGKGFVTTILVQYIMVQALWGSHGEKCLTDRKERIERELRRNF
jgi:hypothetical protein